MRARECIGPHLDTRGRFIGGRPACGRRCVIDPLSEMPARDTDRQRRPSMNNGAVPFSMNKLPVRSLASFARREHEAGMDSTASRYDGGCHQSVRRSILETSQRRFAKSSPAPSRTQSSRPSSALLHSLGHLQPSCSIATVGSLSPNSCRACRMPMMAALGQLRTSRSSIGHSGSPAFRNPPSYLARSSGRRNGCCLRSETRNVGSIWRRRAIALCA
jgi:hypothetical protein